MIHDYDDKNRPLCPSCHKAYIDQDLQQAKKSVKLLREALKHIVAHQELIGGTMAKTSATWAIATAALLAVNSD